MEHSTNKIYLDHNATSPLEEDVLHAIYDALKNSWGNPSCGHNNAGKMAKDVIFKSRCLVASVIGAANDDIIFTSGGTEANNMVLRCMLQHTESLFTGRPHIITSTLEHDSIKLVLEDLIRKELVDVTFVSASKDTAQVIVDDLVAAIRPNTCLITVMMANNGTGVIQPLKEISKALTITNNERKLAGLSKIFLHTDAAQTIGKVKVDVMDLDVDYLTIVGHKFYGPRIGALYVRGLQDKITPMYPILLGGCQERGYRPGTENTGMIAGLGKAAELVINHLDVYVKNMKQTRDYLEDKLIKTFGVENVHFNGKCDKSVRLPNTCNFSFIGEGFRGYKILSNVEYLQASVGAACHSQYTVSQSLLSSGVAENIAANAIRLGTGRYTTKQDIDIIVDDLKNAYNKVKTSLK